MVETVDTSEMVTQRGIIWDSAAPPKLMCHGKILTKAYVSKWCPQHFHWVRSMQWWHENCGSFVHGVFGCKRAVGEVGFTLSPPLGLAFFGRILDGNEENGQSWGP
ncbi:hypothetical protein QJS10_CPB21g00366 [Acorus calamus]|uniref:Uncharacterized protein n=1 Tax=Acorus calamus TaxID=4465 RepID=A0AAV9C1X0_ACOCL|nr:hypothetical protein QJS10_CPB21g00366 [Acorus calamus]